MAIAVDRARLEHVASRLARAAGGGVLGVSGPGGDLAIPFGTLDTASATSVAAQEIDSYAITSITKPFTAVQILTLVDDGLLDLDAPVAEYVPEFGVGGKHDVTTRQILCHCSGLDPSANVIEGPPCDLDADGYLQLALDAGLITLPGETFAYCSPTFWVLAEIVRRLSGSGHVEHLTARVLAPLGTATIGYRAALPEDRRLVAPFTPAGLEHLPEQTTRVAYPAGGLVGRAEDVLALGRCMLNDGVGDRGRVLSAAAARLMRSPHATGMVARRAVRWGLGWELGGPGNLQDPAGLYHAGASGVAMWIDFRAGICATVLTATWGTPRRVFAEAINGIVAASAQG